MTIAIKSPCEGTLNDTPPPGLPAGNHAWILVATILASSMAFIDGTVVNVALPALQATLHATVIGIQWVVEAYALLLASLLLLGGSLGDVYGRRKVFIYGVVIFAVGSAWCGLSPSITSLIVARGVQGIGAALLVPGSLAIISASFRESERGRAIGTWSGFTAITAAVGPVLGGWLIQNLSWRWVFFINLPIAIVVIVITFLHVPESRKEAASSRLDWKGAVLATIGFGAITFALIHTLQGGVIALVFGLVGIVALAGFLWIEAHSDEPMVSPHLFRSRDFSGANLLTFLLYGALSGVLFFFPVNLIEVQGYSATEAGAALLPLILLIFILSRWSGGLVARYGARLPLTIGPLIASLGFALFLRPAIGGSYWSTFFPAVAVLGVGMAISVAPLTTAVMESVPVNEAGVASGVNNAVSRISGLLAVAVFGILLSAGFQKALDRNLSHLNLSATTMHAIHRDRLQLAAIQVGDPQASSAIKMAFVSGYREVVWASVVLSLLSALSSRMISAGKRV